MKRRDFIKTTALAGVGLSIMRYGAVNTFGGAITGSYLRKWAQPLRGLNAGKRLQQLLGTPTPVTGLGYLTDPNGIPCLTGIPDPVFPATTMFQITAGEFAERLHPSMPNLTKLWGYYDSNPAQAIKKHLGGLIIIPRNQAVRLRVTNKLPTLPIIPADVTVPGANLGANRIAVHLHGGFIPWISDGGPFDWFDPMGVKGDSFLNGPGGVLDNIATMPMVAGQADYYYPNDQSFRLMWYHDHAWGITRTNAYAGLATGYLVLDGVNDGYMATGKIPGLGSLIPLVWQDKVFVGPTINTTDPTWPIAQPRKDCQVQGSLWYEHVYNPLDVPLGTWLPLPDPSCVPEFFGDTMLCNGTVSPMLTVEPRRYRFLMLNACNARFLNINLLQVPTTSVEGITLDPARGAGVGAFPNPATNPAGPPIIQLGTEGGFLPREVVYTNGVPFNPATLKGNLLLGNAERADVIIDFTGQGGKDFVLYNDAPGPFPSGSPIDPLNPALGDATDFYPGNPAYLGLRPGYAPDTRQLLRIRVKATGASDPQPAGPILLPALMDPPPLAALPPEVFTGLALPDGDAMSTITPLPRPAGATIVNLTLNEEFDAYGRLIQKLGKLLPMFGHPGTGNDLVDPVTEIANRDEVQVWRIFNLTGDTHPIHFHLVNLQILSRQAYQLDLAGAPVVDPNTGEPILIGLPRGPEPNELGWKETIKMHPGELIELAAKFELTGRVPFQIPSTLRPGALVPGSTGTNHEYVWHCHILEHEEHDMMRPLTVVGEAPPTPSPYAATIPAAGGSAAFSVFNGKAPLLYSSSDANFTVTPNATGFTVSAPALIAGTVATITITDAAGGIGTATVTIG